MLGFSSSRILRAWEIGQPQHPVDRALTLLAAASPESDRETLASWSIGERDAALLALREETFGRQLVARAACPACQEQIELALDTADLRLPPSDWSGSPETVHANGFELTVRLPDSRDLAAITRCEDVAAARAALFRRCVLRARQDGVDLAVDLLPEPVVTTIAAHLAARDPQADLELDLVCIACGYHWLVDLDIASFFWSEISAQAIRLLREVDQLARAYGWREADILALSPVRRQAYLELAT